MPRRPPEIEHVTWADFLSRFRWEQGQHISGIGPTGGGKTTLAVELMHHRATTSRKWHACVIVTKPRDPLLSGLVKRTEWEQLGSWPPSWGTRLSLLWPRWRGRQDDVAQRNCIRSALDDMFSRGHMTVAADELSYLCRKLKLENDLKDWWQQGRSLGNSLVGLTQRPAWVPLDIYSAPRHLFLWRTTDKTDLQRIGGFGGIDAEPIKLVVAGLPEHHVLYVDTRSGALLTTKVERSVTA